MRFHEFDDGLTDLLFLCEEGDIIRMKKQNGKFIHLDDTPYDGKVYYFKKGPRHYFSVDQNAFSEFKSNKKKYD